MKSVMEIESEKQMKGYTHLLGGSALFLMVGIGLVAAIGGLGVLALAVLLLILIIAKQTSDDSTLLKHRKESIYSDDNGNYILDDFPLERLKVIENYLGKPTSEAMNHLKMKHIDELEMWLHSYNFKVYLSDELIPFRYVIIDNKIVNVSPYYLSKDSFLKREIDTPVDELMKRYRVSREEVDKLVELSANSFGAVFWKYEIVGNKFLIKYIYT